MKGKTHSYAALNMFLPFLTVLNNNLFSYKTLVILSFLVLGSLMPDIDIPYSPMGRLFKSISNYIYNRYGHRTITHSIESCLSFSVCLCFIFSIMNLFYPNIVLFLYLVLFFTLGYLSHLCLDLLTQSGVPLFYTETKKKYKLKAFTTGSHDEVLFEFLLILIMQVLRLLKNNLYFTSKIAYLINWY